MMLFKRSAVEAHSRIVRSLDWTPEKTALLVDAFRELP